MARHGYLQKLLRINWVVGTDWNYLSTRYSIFVCSNAASSELLVSVFGSLDLFSITEFVINRLKIVEVRNGMAFRPAVRKAVITNELSLPVADVFAKIIGMWPQAVSY